MIAKFTGRKVYLPQGQSPLKDLNILADCIAGSAADLFNQGEGAIWIVASKCMPVSLNTLREICLKYIVTKHAKETADGWEVEYRPYEPDDMTLRALLMAKTREEGSLVARLPKGAQEPVRLNAQQQREIRDRAAMGEPKRQLADAYKVDVATIEQLAR